MVVRANIDGRNDVVGLSSIGIIDGTTHSVPKENERDVKKYK